MDYKKVISVIAALAIVTVLIPPIATASHSTEVTITPTYTTENRRQIFDITVKNRGPDPIKSVGIEVLPSVLTELIAGENAYVSLRDAAKAYDEIAGLLESIGNDLGVAENELKAYGRVIVDNVFSPIDAACSLLQRSGQENAIAAQVPLTAFAYRLKDAGLGMQATPVNFRHIGENLSVASERLDNAGKILSGDTNENLKKAGDNLQLAAAILDNVAENLRVGSLLTPSLDLAKMADAMISAGKALQNYFGGGQDLIREAGAKLREAAGYLAPPYEVKVETTVIIRGKKEAYNKNTPAQSPPAPWVLYENNPPILAAARAGAGAVIAGGISSSCRNGRWNAGANPLKYLDKFFDAAFQWGKPGATDVLWYEGYDVYNNTTRCSDLVAALRTLGYTVTASSTMPITSSLLAPYDVLIIAQMELGAAGTEGDPSKLPDADVAAIVDFVKAGGVLLLMEGNDTFGYNYNAVQNKILEAFGFGLFFQNDSVYDDVNKWSANNYEIIVDVNTENEIGAAYKTKTGENEIGLYSLCSMAVPLPRARELYNAGTAIKRAGISLEKVTKLLSKVGSDIESYVHVSAGSSIVDATENLDIVDNVLLSGAVWVNDPLAAAATDLDDAATHLREKLGGQGIGIAADNLAAAAEVLRDNATNLGKAGEYLLGASSGFSDASDEVKATATALEPPLGWDWNRAENKFFAMEIKYLGKTIVRGKMTAATIDQTGDTPKKYYGIGERPPIIAATKVGEGAVVAGGIVATCRDNRWRKGELEVFLDNAFQWMVPGAENVLWYGENESYVDNVYNNVKRCKYLIDNLKDMGYKIDNTIDGADTPITPSLLAKYNILVIPQLQSDIPSSYIDAIVDFVEAGGGLLIMDGSDYGGYNFYKVQNKILEALSVGIRFQDDQVNDETNKWDGSHQPIVDVDTTTSIGSAYKDATGKDEIGLYSVCSLIVIEEDPMIEKNENVKLSLLALVQPDIEQPRIKVRTYDVPYGDNFLWGGVVPDLAVNAEQAGTPLGLVGSVNDGGKVTVEVVASEPLSVLGKVTVCKATGENLLPPLVMSPGAENVIWTGVFTVDNGWKDQTIYIKVDPGSKDLLGNEVTEVKRSDNIHVVNSKPTIVDNGFANALASYTFNLKVDNRVLRVTEEPIWELSGRISHVSEYFKSLRFNENWLVRVYINGVEVEKVKRVGENFTFSENEVNLGADGPKTLTLRVVDAAGNAAENILENVFLDNTDPTITVVEIAGRSFRSGIKVNDNTPLLSLRLTDPGYPSTGLGIVENKDVVTWELRDKDNNLIQLENKSSLDNTRKGTISLTLGLPGDNELKEGKYILHVWAFDGIIGNPLNLAYENFMFEVDITPPAMPSAPIVTIPTLTRVPRVTVAGTAEPNSTIKVYVLDETLKTVSTVVGSADSTGSFVIVVPLPEGTSRLEVSATDEAGNESLRRYYGTVTVDSVVPTVTIVSPKPDFSTSEQSIAIVGRVSEPAKWTLLAPVGTWTGRTDAQGNFSVSITLVEGANTISVTAEDDAGNISSPTSITVTRTVTAWGTYAIILVIVALVLAAIAIFRKK